MDYSYEYTSLETSSSSGGMVVYMILMLAISVFAIVSMWKVFKKAGKEGWAALIPIYNLVVLFQISGIDPKKLLWLFLPIIGQIIVFVYLYRKIYKKTFLSFVIISFTSYWDWGDP